ncbi:hypothetical protein ACFPJ1_09360 [Kribbella qitaiheensis]|uniref:hypothetical protein n=1 Tax=Kribbella qitaiheensis TaxID=1544730 RepID=UPI003613579F
MAHTAAANIAAQIRGEQPTHKKAFGDIKAVCVMDAGNNGVIILADKMLPPRQHGVLNPRTTSPPDEVRLREVLPLEDAARLCTTALKSASPALSREARPAAIPAVM